MAFDLRAALLRKEEVESARLMDFEFRQRARTFRLLAEALGVGGDELVSEIALSDDAGILDRLVAERRLDRAELGASYARCRAEAYRQLVGELGDPTPHRLG